MNKSIRKILLFTVLFLSAHCSSVPRQLGIRNVPTEELCPYTLYNKDANDCKPTQGFWQKAHEITYSEFLIDPNDIHNQDIKEDVKKLKEESHKIDRTGIFEKLAKKVWSNYIYQVINKSERSRNLFSEQLEYRSCHSSHYDEFTKYARISQHPKSISLSQIYKKKIITSLSADFENTLKTEDKTLDKKHLAELSSIFRIQIDNELDEQSTTKAELLYIEIGTQTQPKNISPNFQDYSNCVNERGKKEFVGVITGLTGWLIINLHRGTEAIKIKTVKKVIEATLQGKEEKIKNATLSASVVWVQKINEEITTYIDIDKSNQLGFIPYYIRLD